MSTNLRKLKMSYFFVSTSSSVYVPNLALYPEESARPSSASVTFHEFPEAGVAVEPSKPTQHKIPCIYRGRK